MLRSQWLTALCRCLANRPAGYTRRRRKSVASAICRVERLESRLLLSAVGSETNVDVTAASQMTFSPGAVAADDAGDYVVTWTQYGPASDTVYAQRYNAAGIAQGGRITVSPDRSPVNPVEGDFSNSRVAMDADGDFVIVFFSADQDGNGLYAQRYDKNGVAQGTLIQVNNEGHANSNDGGMSVAMDDSGDFVVSWSRSSSSSADIYARRYNASGVAQGGAFQVFTTTSGSSVSSTVAMDATGDFVVAWSSTTSNPSPGAPFISAVAAQRYNSAGTAQGVAIPISTAGSTDFEVPAVAMDDAGDFVVTWADYSSGVNTVLAQRFNASGAAQGTAIQANTTAGNTETRQTSVAMDDDGDFVVTWSAYDFVNGQRFDVLGQRFSAAGAAEGIEFRANTTTTRDQTRSSVAMDATGNFIVTWTSNAQNANNYDVLFQRYLADIPPVLSAIEPYPLSYPPNGPATVITSTLQVSDADDVNLTGATIRITGGYQNGDVLTFVNTATITGVFNPATGTLTLTGTDTVANYQAALRSITYVSSSQDPSARTISFQVTDGVETSNVVTRAVGGLAQLNGTTLTVYGTLGNDVITVSEAANLTVVVDGVTLTYTPAQVVTIIIYGYDGNDSIVVNSLVVGTDLTAFGGKGNDSIVISGSVTNGVTLNGDDGNDVLLSGSGNDTLNGGVGDDWLNGGVGFDNLIGGVGNDVYAFSDTPTNEIDRVFELAGEGTDLLNFTDITSAVTADLTSDSTLAYMGHRIVQTGAAGEAANFENVNGGSANDFLVGNAANNVIYGNGGNDTLKGGDGSDQLVGGLGNDLLMGGNQDDFLYGGDGDDYLMGEAGNDWLSGDDGFDTLVGSTGNDTYLFTETTINQIDTVIELVGEGTDTLDFSAMTTAVTVDLTSDAQLSLSTHRIVSVGSAGQSANFENVTGGSGNDQITGNAANNLLAGGIGNDTISGGSGNDILLGGAGNDTLKGISGQNILIGGTGGDLILGGTGDDILLSGSSTYESDPGLLQALMAEWASGNTYQVRVNHLISTPGGANDFVYLRSPAVVDDPDSDYLTGGSGQDWFLADVNIDVVTDKVAGEIQTSI